MDAEQHRIPPGMPGGLAPWWYLTVAVFAVHNAEEYLRDLPGWAAEHAPPWIAAVHSGQPGFGLAVGLLTLAALLVAVLASTLRPTWSAEVLVCFAVVLLINAASHLAVSALTFSAMPGVFTSPLILVLGTFLVTRLPRVRATWSTVLATALVAVFATVGTLLLAGWLVS
ncbi:HXXEE domain-containing protein [Nocardiopsis valliformis]|uniref:HXXEE domain-containing protein n=1 Tax=Nocardiopsis valliformis TaxID=239974 RepID=UPI000345B7C4|nr:HXXEE domain-containing protein [Nocardiopsis valliformis]